MNLRTPDDFLSWLEDNIKNFSNFGNPDAKGGAVFFSLVEKECILISFVPLESSAGVKDTRAFSLSISKTGITPQYAFDSKETATFAKWLLSLIRVLSSFGHTKKSISVISNQEIHKALNRCYEEGMVTTRIAQTISPAMALGLGSSIAPMLDLLAEASQNGFKY